MRVPYNHPDKTELLRDLNITVKCLSRGVSIFLGIIFWILTIIDLIFI
ncbi:putative membrane protein [Acanthamoeba polyphaga mimivirus]|uniref:Putative membrane protein n=1 Tax=Acanthamoeba polyphaga mimivirus TaxID=212035 RepID=A0A0G2Y4I7_MIMIV|nr:putative membrane protein [Acanthamoeba polyphaga mimivirus]